MTTTFTRSAIGALTTAIDGVATTGLRNLAAATCRLGPEITPTVAGPELIATYKLSAKFITTNPTANAVIAQCWFLVDVGNGAGYPTMTGADGSTTMFPGWAPDFAFTWDNSAGHLGAPDVMQSIPREVARPASKFKILFRNMHTTATANTNDTDTILKESIVNELAT